MIPQEVTSAVLLADLAPEPIRARIEAAARDAGDLLVGSVGRVVTRVLGLCALGIALSWALFVLTWAVGWLDALPWYGMAGLWFCTVNVGAVVLGYVGFWRGIGSVLLYLGIERGLVALTVNGLLGRLVAAMGLEATGKRLENLPLQRWEDALKRAVGELEGAPPGGAARQLAGLGRRAVLRIRRVLHELIEKAMLTTLREEARADGSGGGLSLVRIGEVIYGRVESLFAAMIRDMMRRHLRLGLTVVALASVLPALVIWLLS